MTNHIVLQRFTRVSLLGIDVEARTDLADEPVIEAGALGQLLEYKESYLCRRLVRRLLDDERLSWRSCHGGSTENAAENSGLTVANHDPAKAYAETRGKLSGSVDVFVVTEREQVGTVVRDVDKLWLTERACLLVATASETERAWQVRTALVDFFLACRREGIRNGTVENSSMAGLELIRDEVRQLADEARAIEQRVVHSMAIDTRLRALEARRPRQPPQQTSPTDALRSVVLRVLADHPSGLTTSELLDIARDDIDAARGRTTTAMPLGREIGRMPEIERRWRHGHVSVWALKHREPS